MVSSLFYCFFFFNDTATTEIYTLSLHDALPIWLYENLLRLPDGAVAQDLRYFVVFRELLVGELPQPLPDLLVIQRSEEHTSELQSRQYLVCRLLLEKKKTSITPDRLHDLTRTAR